MTAPCALTPAIRSPLAVPLRGPALRYVLVNELMAHSERSVAQLVATIAAHGYSLTGRASKTISDALRWEIGHGRVQRLGRGRYRFLRTSRSTTRRIRRFATLSHQWAHAARHHQTPPSVPKPDPARYPRDQPWAFPSPPWISLRWLWST